MRYHPRMTIVMEGMHAERVRLVSLLCELITISKFQKNCQKRPQNKFKATRQVRNVISFQISVESTGHRRQIGRGFSSDHHAYGRFPYARALFISTKCEKNVQISRMTGTDNNTMGQV